MDAINDFSVTPLDVKAMVTQTKGPPEADNPVKAVSKEEDVKPHVAVSRQDMAELAAEVKSHLELLGQGHVVEIRNEEKTGRPIIEIKSKDGKVLNSFPPKKVLNLRRVLADLSGMVINRMT